MPAGGQKLGGRFVNTWVKVACFFYLVGQISSFITMNFRRPVTSAKTEAKRAALLRHGISMGMFLFFQSNIHKLAYCNENVL